MYTLTAYQKQKAKGMLLDGVCSVLIVKSKSTTNMPMYPDSHYPYSEVEFFTHGPGNKPLRDSIVPPKLPKAIIVDIDGTLAKMNGRGPFDWHRVGEDDINPAVQLLVGLYSYKGEVIIFSGRDSVCRQLTIDWLTKHKIPCENLFMRPEGNFEKDNIIKRRLYDEHVKGKYDIEFVVDDRDQVVEMWRKDLGLTCFQVDYGNF